MFRHLCHFIVQDVYIIIYVLSLSCLYFFFNKCNSSLFIVMSNSITLAIEDQIKFIKLLQTYTIMCIFHSK